MLIIKMSLQKPDEDNMNPSHSETTQQSLEMKKERATRKQQKRVDIDAILNLMSKEIRGKLLIPNVHMDAIYIRSLFSGPDRALIGRNRQDDALQVVAYFSLPVRTIVKKKAWLFDCTSVQKNCASKEGAALQPLQLLRLHGSALRRPIALSLAARLSLTLIHVHMDAIYIRTVTTMPLPL